MHIKYFAYNVCVRAGRSGNEASWGRVSCQNVHWSGHASLPPNVVLKARAVDPAISEIIMLKVPSGHWLVNLLIPTIIGINARP